MRKGLIIGIGILVIFSLATAVYAGERATTKFDRGAKNIALGWTDIPKNIVDTSKNQNMLVGATVGTVKGVFQAVARTVSGVVDVVTFPVGTYDEPAIKPAMIGDAPDYTLGPTAGDTEGKKKSKPAKKKAGPETKK